MLSAHAVVFQCKLYFGLKATINSRLSQFAYKFNESLGEQLLWKYYYRYQQKAAYRPQQWSKQVPAKISILSVNWCTHKMKSPRANIWDINLTVTATEGSQWKYFAMLIKVILGYTHT